MNPSVSPDALLFIASQCPHCPAVLAGLAELLKRGVMTYNGFMLPSYAHDDAVLELTLDRIGQAFEAVRAAERAGRLDDAIDIPYL